MVIVFAIWGCTDGAAPASPPSPKHATPETSAEPVKDAPTPEQNAPAAEEVASRKPVDPNYPRKTLKDWTAVLPRCDWQFGMVQAYEDGVTAERWVCELQRHRSVVFELVSKQPAASRPPGWWTKGVVPADPKATVRLLDFSVAAGDFKVAQLKLLAEMTGISTDETDHFHDLIVKAFKSGATTEQGEAVGTMVGPGGETRLMVFHFDQPEFGASFRAPGRK